MDCFASRAVATIAGYDDVGCVIHSTLTGAAGARYRLRKAMETEFKRAVLPEDMRRLLSFDRRVFPESDLFSVEAWKGYEPYWMIVNGAIVGCCAFEAHVDFQEDIREDGVNPRMKGSLYISTTGISPKYQGAGLGRLFKSWQIAHARYHGFYRVVTNMRKRNARIIALNKWFGFQILRTTPGYYNGPTDSTVVMELLVGPNPGLGRKWNARQTNSKTIR
jgi:GNAT superfamily N-acetyltransferase